MTPRKSKDPVPVEQYVSSAMASICTLGHPREKRVLRRAGRIADLLCCVAVPDSHCQSVLENFRLMAAAIGGDQENPLLTRKERGDFMHARAMLTLQLRRVTTRALAGSRAPEPIEAAALDMHTNIAEPPLASQQQAAASG